MDNAYTGETSLRMGGRVYTLIFDWSALARLRTEFGPDYLGAVNMAVATSDAQALAKIIGAALPDLPPDEVMRLSPPIEEAANAILLALNRTLKGVEALEQHQASGKKTEGPQRPSLWTQLWTLLRWHRGLALPRPNSGG